VAVLLFLFRRVLRKKRINFIARFTLFFMLIMSEISLHVWLYWMDAWGYKHSLPLHLSSVTLLLSAVLLLTKRFSLFEFTYFAGVGSALQAMLTPDISEYTFPHYRYVHFFVSHGGTVIANLFIVFVEGFRPTFRSVWKAFLWLNVYVVFIIFVNFFLGGNYMYLAEKPVNPSMLDYLGPWPVYILPLEVITVVTFLLLYVPFWLLALWKKKEL
jgi:hypothetical integral membrane protein (TIGR02206 family)